jgi:N-acetylmuramoyl-L-alanine amidase
MLKAAVQDNADVMAGRLPAALRPSRRFMYIWGRRLWLLTLPISIIAGSAVVTQLAVDAQPVHVPAPVFDLARGRSADMRGHPLDAFPDPSVLSRPLRADVLSLGVRRVVIDPGHGGEHFGTSSASGLLEKDLTLDLANRARQLLTESGLEVVLTRTGDDTLSLKQRAATANARRGDIFVSIHLNALEPASVRGIETYYLGPSERPEHDAIAAEENQHSGYSLADMRALLDNIYADARRDESKRLAESVQRAVVGRLRTIDPSIRDRGVKTAPFIVLVATGMPAILAEVSCLSNAEEAERLGTAAYRQTIAEALVAGIQAFIDQNHTRLEERKDISES